MATASVQSVAAAMNVMYNKNSSTSERTGADEWLREFQKGTDAWAVADAILKMDASVGVEVLVFAAQTLRQKTRYDLSQLNLTQQTSQRDSLLSLASKYKTGPRAVTRQLCLALAALAAHLSASVWLDPVASLLDVFYTPADWPILVSLLSAMPFEFEDSTTDSSFFDADPNAHGNSSSRRETVIFRNSNRVLLALMTILEKCGNSDLLRQTLDCIRVWIESGDISLEKIAATGLMQFCFSCVASPNQDESVFETSIDVICEIIRRSGSRLASARGDQTIIMPLVETIYAGIVGLSPILNAAANSNANEDLDQEERMRGLCRLYVNAGESYLSLILQHLEAWHSIVEGILACTSVADLEIVAITFQFWLILTEEVTSPGSERLKLVFVDIYRRLNDVMIHHLHYPLDNSWTAEERDEFREFRHNMGDVLKACVLVLGQEEALARPYAILQSFVVADSASLNGTVAGTLNPDTPWQKIEAPLFALRTMGRNIRNDEGTVLPVIMSMLPQLPAHPKVRYAAILVIGRYASWTRLHPEFIPYQMTFISKGFEDVESVGAASQALKFLCDECGDMLVDYLSQLHPFYMSIGKVLDRHEQADVITALAHVIKHVPVQSPDASNPDMLKVLEMFCLPIAQRLHEIGSSVAPAGGFTKDLQVEVSELIDQFSVFIYNAQPDMSTLPATLPHPCLTLFTNMWPVFESLLRLHDPKITNSVCRCIVKCVEAHRGTFKPIAQVVLPTLAANFEATKVTSLLWACSKCVKQFGSDDALDGDLMKRLCESVSGSAFEVIRESKGKVDHVSDMVEDFFMLLSAFANTCPSHFLKSSLLGMWLQCAIACMRVQQLDAWLAVYSDFLKSTLTLASNNSAQQNKQNPQSPQQIPLNCEPLLTLLLTNGLAQELMNGIVRGIGSTFPYREDLTQEEGSGASTVGSCVLSLSDVVARAGGSADGAAAAGRGGILLVGNALQGIEDEKFLDAEKAVFAEKLGVALDKRDVYRIDSLMHEYGVKYRRRNHNRKG
ncbi:Nuclear import receptor [Chytriomyces hyalinus]|nr:Nuclear import receptor [Chytriomyces hyalinus]